MKPGDRLGPYEVASHLGAGGMGEVRKARGTRLDRTVAVKISAEQFSERFDREDEYSRGGDDDGSRHCAPTGWEMSKPGFQKLAARMCRNHGGFKNSSTAKPGVPQA